MRATLPPCMKLISSLLLCLPLCLAGYTAHAAAADSTPPPAPPPEAAPASGVASLALPDPVAEVEGQKITRPELESTLTKLLSSRGKTLADFTEQQRMQGCRAVLNQMILQRLVAKRSADVPVSDAELEDGYSRFKTHFRSEQDMNDQMAKTGETVDSVKKGIRASIQQRKWIQSQIGDKNTVSEADAQSYYDKNPDQFKTRAAQVRASHILIAVPPDAAPDVVAAKQKAAQAALDRVNKGEDFGKVAADVSDDPGSKTNGGDLNFFSREQMVPEFSDAAFKLKKGEIAGPVKSQFGFHIIKVTDRKEAGSVISFPEVKEKLVAALSKQKQTNAVETVLAQMREKADVKVFLPATAPMTPPNASPAASPAS
jgi:parvulin-like peptidyl-prolyl isomerase